MKVAHSTPLAASTMPQDVNSTTEIEEKIRCRAFELYEQRGREDGHELDDWLEAETEVLQVKPKRSAA